MQLPGKTPEKPVVSVVKRNIFYRFITRYFTAKVYHHRYTNNKNWLYLQRDYPVLYTHYISHGVFQCTRAFQAFVKCDILFFQTGHWTQCLTDKPGDMAGSRKPNLCRNWRFCKRREEKHVALRNNNSVSNIRQYIEVKVKTFNISAVHFTTFFSSLRVYTHMKNRGRHNTMNRQIMYIKR